MALLGGAGGNAAESLAECLVRCSRGEEHTALLENAQAELHAHGLRMAWLVGRVDLVFGVLVAGNPRTWRVGGALLCQLRHVLACVPHLYPSMHLLRRNMESAACVQACTRTVHHVQHQLSPSNKLTPMQMELDAGSTA